MRIVRLLKSFFIVSLFIYSYGNDFPFVASFRQIDSCGGWVVADLRSLGLIGLEAHLQNAVAERVAVERLDGDDSLVVVRHSNKAKTFALIGL